MINKKKNLETSFCNLYLFQTSTELHLLSISLCFIKSRNKEIFIYLLYTYICVCWLSLWNEYFWFKQQQKISHAFYFKQIKNDECNKIKKRKNRNNFSMILFYIVYIEIKEKDQFSENFFAFKNFSRSLRIKKRR